MGPPQVSAAPASGRAAMAFVARKAGYLLAMVLVVTALTSALTKLLPGDVAVAVLGSQATEENVAALRARLGLDAPWPVQYGRWLAGVATGDFGHSPRTGESISAAIADRLPVTLEVVVLAQLLAIAIGVPLGIWGAARRDGWIDRLITGSAFGLIAMTICLPSMQEWGALFGASQAQVQLTFSGFVVAYGLFQLVHGPLSDRVGRKAVLMLGIACLGAGSLLAALAPTFALRERLRSYVAALSVEAAATGMPMLRPLALEFPNDPGASTPQAEACFMLGSEWLARPVTDFGARAADVYLPPLPAGAQWVNAFNASLRFPGGGVVTIDAPLEQLPLFQRVAPPRK